MVDGRITKTHLDVVQMMLITMQKKIFKNFQNCGFLPSLKFWNFFRRPTPTPTPTRLKIFLWGLFLIANKMDQKNFSNSNFLVFLGIRFETHQNSGKVENSWHQSEILSINANFQSVTEL